MEIGREREEPGPGDRERYTKRREGEEPGPGDITASNPDNPNLSSNRSAVPRKSAASGFVGVSSLIRGPSVENGRDMDRKEDKLQQFRSGKQTCQTQIAPRCYAGSRSGGYESNKNRPELAEE
eukprot:sb/3475869/